jgi:Ca2+/Na+ antiporter
MMEEDDDDALITMTTALAFSVRLIKATTHFARKISIIHLQGMFELHYYYYYYYYYYTINRRLEKPMTTSASNSKSKVLIPFLLAFCLNFYYFQL